MESPQLTRMLMRKQDPTVDTFGVRAVLVAGPIEPGPRSRWVVMVDSAVEPDENGDFVAADHGSDDALSAFDAVHTFAVVHRVVGLFERCLRRLGHLDSWTWDWGDEPLRVRHRAGTRRAARYRSGPPGRLDFYSFESPHVPGIIHTCQSFDAVAHEAGHAILDQLRPAFLASNDVDALALHESFGDVTAIFALLDHLDACEAVVAESKADLSRATFLSSIAEEFGRAYSGLEFGIRNARHSKTLGEAGRSNIYQRSQVLTGAVYDLLNWRFATTLEPRAVDPALTLYLAAAETLERLMKAILELPERKPTFRRLATEWLNAEAGAAEGALREILERRQIPFDGTETEADARPPSVESVETLDETDEPPPNFMGTCSTISSCDGSTKEDCAKSS